MPETAVKTRDQVIADQIQFILRQDWFHPDTLRRQIQAVRQIIASGQETDDQRTPLNQIKQSLAQFNRALGFRIDPKSLDILNSHHLEQLEQALNEIQSPSARPPAANIPPDLKALVAEFEKAHRAAAAAAAQRQGWSPQKFRDQIALQNQITIQMGVVRQATLSQLGLVIDNSQYLENLAASLGRRPEAVKRLAKMRLANLVDQNITAQTFRQMRLISKDPSQLAALFVKNLKAGLDDDLVKMAVATNKTDAKKAFQEITKTAAQETEKAKPAIAAAAENLKDHPTVAAAARRAAAAAVETAETVSLSPQKRLRLAQELAKYQDKPQVREKIISRALRIPAAQAKLVRASLDPSVSRLAASTQKLNPLLAADPASILADALRHPRRFPKPFVAAVKSGKISDSEIAAVLQTSRILNIPADAVILRYYGIDAQKLAGRWQTGDKFLGFIPMGHAADQAGIAKLSSLAAAQKTLHDSLETPPQFLRAARSHARANAVSDFFDQINLLRLPRAVSFNLGRIPPLGSLGNAGSTFISGLRVQSAPINSFFNFISSAGNFVRQAPSFLTAPFRAVGSAISNRIINPVKTWAGTQIKSGLARAGAWLAKKGVTEAAKKLGGALIGKAAAGLLGAAVGGPVGWVAGAITLLSTLGDIGKFIWANRKEIGFGLGGGFLLGQLLLGKLLGLLGSAAWTLGGALTGGILGFMVGGPVGAVIGSLAGGAIGYLISTGALSSALAGFGTALANAAAGLSSFIGAITAPSAFIGLGSTVAAVGLLGVGVAWAIQTFFIQPTVNSALFVAPDAGVMIGEEPSFIGFPSEESFECTNEDKPLPFYNTANSPIARRAWEIVNGLRQGFWCYWNNQPEYPELFNLEWYQREPNPCHESYEECEAKGRRRPMGYDLFWCTWLVIKSYQEAGRPIDAITGAHAMKDDFQARGKYIARTDATYHDLSPGDAIFLNVVANNPNNPDWIGHAAIIYHVTADYIITIDSNAGAKTHVYTVGIDGRIQDLTGVDGQPLFRVIGFGKP